MDARTYADKLTKKLTLMDVRTFADKLTKKQALTDVSTIADKNTKKLTLCVRISADKLGHTSSTA